MKIYIALFFAVLISACSHQDYSASRTPASALDAHSEYTLEALLSADNPRAEAKAYVERLLQIRIRASAWVAEFDKTIAENNQAMDIFELPSYRKLLATRPLVERIERQIADIYRKALEFSETKGSDPEGRNDKALLVVAGLRDALAEVRQDRAKAVLLHDLLVRLKKTLEKTKFNGSFDEPLSHADLALAAAKSAPDIEAISLRLPLKDRALREVEQEERELGFDAKPGRDPQSLNIYPSAGPNGNLSGPSFPTGTWALTFDDGPHHSHTLVDLAVLKEAGIKATFFWLAENVKRLPVIVKDVQSAGMAVENHSWSHPNLSSPQKLEEAHTSLDREINQSTVVDTEAYGVKPRFFRCPYGAGIHNAAVREMIAKQGLIHVGWNVDSLDWHDKNPASVLARVERQMAISKRGIILFHDIQPHTPGVVKELLAKKKGSVRWVTLPEITDELNHIGGAKL